MKNGGSVVVDQTTVNQATAKILGRIERLPLSAWHLKVRAIIGTSTLFDGVDSVTIALVLPVLGALWHLTPGQIGLLISGGLLGQMVGAAGFGRMAERFGRISVIIFTTAIFAIANASCALAVGFASLLVLRIIQGFGLGAEVPIGAAYINEIAPARSRGRFVLLYELLFAIGILVTGFLGRWIIPAYGWKVMFLLGGIPPLVAVVLMFRVPESPRWLIGRGRLEEADRVVSDIEEKILATGKTLPPPIESAPAAAVSPGRWMDLFSSGYGVRTLVQWSMWVTIGFISWPLTIWMPSIYSSVFHLPLKQTLNYAMFNNITILAGTVSCVFLIDITGRKKWFAGCFFVAALALVALGLSGVKSATEVFWLTTVTLYCITSLNLGIFLYTCEIYPTRMRALGCGVGMALSKLAGMIAPPAIGWSMAGGGLPTVFIVLGLISAATALITILLGVETKKRILEEVSP